MTGPATPEGIFDLGGGPTPTTDDDDGRAAPPTPTTSAPTLTSAPTSTPAPASPLHPRDLPDLREAVRDAASAGTSLRVVGAGGWLDAGRRIRTARSIHLGALSGIVEYVPGDLTMTARAGTPLAELQAAARAEGQFLPLDPWGGDAGTLGATLATATAGPLSTAFGLPRDVALGVSFVSGTGEAIRGGGRVVKNVAGFDLVRLTVGAWGTLGVIAEATVRLRALPERDISLALHTPSGAELAPWLARLRSAPIVPLAMELLNRPTARAIGVDSDGATDDTLLIRLAGNARAVEAERGVLAALGDAVEVDVGCWDRLRSDLPGAGAVVRWSAPIAALGGLWLAARSLARSFGEVPPPGAQHPPRLAASVARGVVRMQLPAADHDLLLQRLRDSLPSGAALRAELLPAPLWRPLAPGVMAHPLSRGVRHAFDPHRILNPGILGDEGQDVGSRTRPVPSPS